MDFHPTRYPLELRTCSFNTISIVVKNLLVPEYTQYELLAEAGIALHITLAALIISSPSSLRYLGC